MEDSGFIVWFIDYYSTELGEGKITIYFKAFKQDNVKPFLLSIHTEERSEEKPKIIFATNIIFSSFSLYDAIDLF